ncbi:aminotransferase class I/II-fold pyridoxal phosphate-dependent enzyme [Streptomyces sp. CAU 1734]|uniref:pyridoxal phosphate-dependent decarboxylase family protein n=1 Tax=Streptomyces sp. CAU 1734 TaxID=3140360 RepID=UPI003260F5C4
MTGLRPGLEPRQDEIAAMMASATSFVTDFIGNLDTAPLNGLAAPGTAGPSDDVAALLAPPAEHPGEFGDLLQVFRTAAEQSADTAGPNTFAYFPGGGLFTAALAELLACTVNRFTAASSMAPGLVAMEHGVIHWFARQFGLPATAGGLITTGASTGALSALLTARRRLLGDAPYDNSGTVYVTTHTHLSVSKAARIAGLSPDQVRLVPVTDDLRMDADAATRMIEADRAAGKHPFLIVATAGTTDTGAVDPIGRLADTARAQNMWFHVDAAYGGGFQLTARGRAKLDGIDRADSIALDPHKSMFFPYSSGVLLVRDERLLHAAHSADAPYLQDMDRGTPLPDYQDLGTEMSRGYRGLRLWLPLHLHGVAAFRAALDEKLDLAESVHRALADLPELDVLTPDLTVINFRLRGGEEINRTLLETIHADRRVHLTSTRIRGEYTLRLCVLNHRTHRRHVDQVISIVRDAVRTVTAATAAAGAR